MKKTLICAALLVGITVLAATVTSGFGKKVLADSTPTILTVGNRPNTHAEFLHVTVTRGEVRLMINTPTAEFVSTNALVVTAGFPQTFWTGGDIRFISYATESGTADVIFNLQ